MLFVDAFSHRRREGACLRPVHPDKRLNRPTGATTGTITSLDASAADAIGSARFRKSGGHNSTDSELHPNDQRGVLRGVLA